MLFSSIFLLMLPVAPLANWEIISETVDCIQDVKIAAMEGQPIMHAFTKGRRIRLYAEGNYVYQKGNPFEMVFRNTLGEVEYEYTHPDIADTTPKREIRIKSDTMEVICKMHVK